MEENKSNFLKPLEEDKSSNLKNNENRDFFLVDGVEPCCYPHLKVIFQTLLLQKKIKQQVLADFLGVDKAYVSRMVNGLIIPPLRVRLKVAEFFGVDSVLIWRLDSRETKGELNPSKEGDASISKNLEASE